MNRLYLSQPFVACYENNLDAYIPELWAQEGLAILEENMVMANLVHRDFENEIAKFGDVVNTRKPGEFKIRRKTDGTTLTQQDATATNVPVPLDQWFYSSLRDPRRGRQQVLPGVEGNLPPAGDADHRPWRRSRLARSGPRLPRQPGEPRGQLGGLSPATRRTTCWTPARS